MTRMKGKYHHTTCADLSISLSLTSSLSLPLPLPFTFLSPTATRITAAQSPPPGLFLLIQEDFLWYSVDI